MFNCSKSLLIYFLICGFANSFYAASSEVMPVLQKKEANEGVLLSDSAGSSDRFSRRANAQPKNNALVEKCDELIVKFNNSRTLKESHELSQQIEEVASQLGNKFMSSIAKGTKQIYRDYWHKIENPLAE